MTKLLALQLSLIAESDFDELPVGDWDYDQLGTDEILVPNSSIQKLGTKKILVPNFPHQKLGTKEWTAPDYSAWTPPIGCFQQKWIKDHQYWYWRYYDNRGKKASLYLHKDYNKAVLKAIKIGVPSDAKCLSVPTTQTDPQISTPTQINPLNIASTAHPASRDPLAA